MLCHYITKGRVIKGRPPNHVILVIQHEIADSTFQLFENHNLLVYRQIWSAKLLCDVCSQTYASSIPSVEM